MTGVILGLLVVVSLWAGVALYRLAVRLVRIRQLRLHFGLVEDESGAREILDLLDEQLVALPGLFWRPAIGLASAAVVV